MGEEIRGPNGERIVRVLRSTEAPPQSSNALLRAVRAWAEARLAPPPSISQDRIGEYKCIKVSGTTHVDGEGDYRILAHVFVSNGYLYRIEQLWKSGAEHEQMEFHALRTAQSVLVLNESKI